MCKDDKVLTALQMEMVCHRLRFLAFLGTSDPEWVLLESLVEILNPKHMREIKIRLLEQI